jgi:hypothetical protein
MGLVWLRWRAELRGQWRATLALALVLGIGGGVALTALAGARRTDTAMPRFLRYNLTDVGGFLYGNPSSPPVEPGPAGRSLDLAPLPKKVAELPQVQAYFRAPYLFLTTDPSGHMTGTVNTIAAADASLFRTVDRPRVLSGRLADPGRADEAVINPLAAAKSHLQVGSTVTLYAYSAAQLRNGDLTAGVQAAVVPPDGPTFTVRITGVVRAPSDVSAVIPLAAKQDVTYEGQQNLFVTPAFLLRLATSLGLPVQQLPGMNLVGVRLRHGAADWGNFAAAASVVGGSAITTSPGDVNGARAAGASAERGAHLEVVALTLFGLLSALVTIVLVGQAVARHVALQADDYAVLRAFGARRSQMVGVAALRGGLVGFMGATVAFVVAGAASPLMPIGLARQAEVHPGVEMNLAILLPGAFALALITAAWTGAPAWRISRRWASSSPREAGAHASRVVAALSRWSLPPAALTGVRFGLDGGQGQLPVPVGTAIVGAGLAVAALVATLTFGTSLDHLVSSPRLQGWNWDAIVGNLNDQTDREAQAAPLLAANPLVESSSAIAILAGPNQGTAQLDGHTIGSMIAIDPIKGSAYPPLLHGREPRADDEIVLASGTMRQLHRRIGDVVHIPTPSGVRTLTVVGEMIAPSFGGILTDNVGDGVWIYGPVVRQAQAQATPQANGPPPAAFVLFAVRYKAGASRSLAYASLRRDFGRHVLTHLPGPDVINLQSVDRLPLLLAGLVVLIGLVTVGNTLITSVRRRRRDLATLKTIGFLRRQVAAVIGWQTTSILVVALIIGLPLGIAGGRWAWQLVAASINSRSPALVPSAAIGIVAPVALLAGLALSAWPAWSAAQVKPAVAMRRE